MEAEDWEGETIKINLAKDYVNRWKKWLKESVSGKSHNILDENKILFNSRQCIDGSLKILYHAASHDCDLQKTAVLRGICR